VAVQLTRATDGGVFRLANLWKIFLELWPATFFMILLVCAQFQVNLNSALSCEDVCTSSE
jgi:hypothetical protein